MALSLSVILNTEDNPNKLEKLISVIGLAWIILPFTSLVKLGPINVGAFCVLIGAPKLFVALLIIVLPNP
jgi:hypothetical protein